MFRCNLLHVGCAEQWKSDGRYLFIAMLSYDISPYKINAIKVCPIFHNCQSFPSLEKPSFTRAVNTGNFTCRNTGQFKKKATLSHVHNKVTGEHTKCGTAVVQLLQSWSSHTAGYRTPFDVESPSCNTVSPGGGGPKHFLASITNKLWEFS
jgi:hypothetical protein